MTHLPRISGQNCVTALEKLGFVVRRQHGSHIILRRNNPFGQVIVANHKELDTGTLRAILRQANVSVEDFHKLV